MRIIIFFVTCIICALSCLALTATAHQQQQVLRGGWTLHPTQRCAHTPNTNTTATTVRFEVFLKLRNRHRLSDESAYTDGDGDDSGDGDLIKRRLERARAVFGPTEADFASAEKTHLNDFNCTRNWNSIACRGVAPAAAERLLGVRLCWYSHPAYGDRLLSDSDDMRPSLAHERVDYVAGLVAFKQPVRFGASKKKEHDGERVLFAGGNASSNAAPTATINFPAGAQKSPVILFVTVVPASASNMMKLSRFDIALNCFDASATVYSNNGSITCASGASASVNVPASLVVQVTDVAAQKTVGTTGSIALSSATRCGTATSFGYGSSANANVAVCRFDLSGQAALANLETWKSYSIAAATSTIGGARTTLFAPIKNFFNGAFQANAHGTGTSVVAPIMTLSSQPAYLRQFMNIQDTEVVAAANTVSQAVIEFAQQRSPGGGYDKSDLAAYMTQTSSAKWYDPSRVFYAGEEYFSKLPSDESALDIELMVGVARGAPTVFWAIDVGADSSFLDAVVSCFQTFVKSGGPPTAVGVTPSVVSISYGIDEGSVYNENPQAFAAADAHLQIMSHAGITTFVSSGDAGASCENADLPSVYWPASAMHAVAVGATSFVRSQSNPDDVTETTCSALQGNVITSAGGFSKHVAAPDFQKALVAPPPQFAGRRGVPDVAALGANLYAVSGGHVMEMFGTSAAAPIMAATTTLLNNRLRLNGNATLRKANYFFYDSKVAGAGFADVMLGDNCAGRTVNSAAASSYQFPTFAFPNCFASAAGWDAVTGVGTPRYDRLLKLLIDWTPPPDTPAPVPWYDDVNSWTEQAWNWIKTHKWIAIGILAGACFLIVAGCCYCSHTKRKEERQALLGMTGGGGGGGLFVPEEHHAQHAHERARNAALIVRGATTPRSGRTPRSPRRAEPQPAGESLNDSPAGGYGAINDRHDV